MEIKSVLCTGTFLIEKKADKAKGRAENNNLHHFGSSDMYRWSHPWYDQFHQLCYNTVSHFKMPDSSIGFEGLMVRLSSAR
jgi:hypothetical protein